MMRLKTPDDGGHVLFSTDGKGRWWKRTWCKRCTEEVFLFDQCQGVSGHKGVHWSYSPSGSFCWSDNKEDPCEGHEKGSAGSTPPDHFLYVSPRDMVENYYLSTYEDVEVIDLVEIARLEADETTENESVNRPVTEAEIESFGW